MSEFIFVYTVLEWEEKNQRRSCLMASMFSKKLEASSSSEREGLE